VTESNVFQLSQPGSFADPLTEVLRNGARALLAQAVEAEVAALLASHADKLIDDGRQRLVRHGHLPEREVMTGIGPVAVRCPRVRDRVGKGGEGIRFSSAILPPYARRSKSLEVLIPILYLKGVSTGDFEEALSALVGQDAGGLSASTIGRLKEAWSEEHARWSRRDLSARRYVYFWVDGIHVQARLEDEAQCLLVIIGATPEGEKELVGLTDGVRESAQSWKELLLDLKRRGLTIGPELAVADGALGFWKAVEEVWPKTRGQRCWVHKTANVLNKLPKSQQPKAKRALQEIWMAAANKDAIAAFDAFIETWGVKYEKAVECLSKDRDALLAFYDFPAEHWKHLRTTNIIESSFATVRHRTVRSKGCLQQNRARHDLQARRGGPEELAPPQRPQPVAQTHPRGKVQRRNRGPQIASSSRCRLTPSVTKIRR
jgi:transposase-like protein